MIGECHEWSSNPMSTDRGGIGLILIAFAVHGIFAMTIVVIADSGIFQNMWHQFMCIAEPDRNHFYGNEDPDITRERAVVFQLRVTSSTRCPLAPPLGTSYSLLSCTLVLIWLQCFGKLLKCLHCLAAEGVTCKAAAKFAFTNSSYLTHQETAMCSRYGKVIANILL